MDANTATHYYARRVLWKSSFLGDLKPSNKNMTFGELQLEEFLFLYCFFHLVCQNQTLIEIALS